jgi:hypothetical protein
MEVVRVAGQARPMARPLDSLVLALLVVTAGCEPMASPVDAGSGTDTGVAADVPGLDAPSGDAGAGDAGGSDAPGLDAPGLDAPGLDAPALDAPGLADAPALLDAPGLDVPVTHAVRYDGNGATAGTAPVDAMMYPVGATVTVADPGTLVRAGSSFAGWNTSADGLGTARAPGSTFVMGAGDVTLYAVWSSLPTYGVTYHADDRTSGTVPTDPAPYLAGATVAVAAIGDLARTGYTFSTWSTTPSGSGTSRAPGSTFSMPAAGVDLYSISTHDGMRSRTRSATTRTGRAGAPLRSTAPRTRSARA